MGAVADHAAPAIVLSAGALRECAIRNAREPPVNLLLGAGCAHEGGDNGYDLEPAECQKDSGASGRGGLLRKVAMLVAMAMLVVGTLSVTSSPASAWVRYTATVKNLVLCNDPPAGPPSLPTPPLEPLVRDVLPGVTSGVDALEALAGDEFATVARQNGQSVEAFAEVLANDPTAFLDGDGKLLYRDPGVTAGYMADAIPAEPAPYANSETFLLHSRPGSNRLLYIDFDGYSLPAGTAWRGGAAYNALPYARTATAQPGARPSTTPSRASGSASRRTMHPSTST